MADQPLPQGASVGTPLPANATVGQPAAETPLPQGATVGAPADGGALDRRAHANANINFTPEAPEGVLSGITHGFENATGETVNTATRLANRILPDSMQIPQSANNTTNTTGAEKVGGFAENVAEFVTGDAALDAALTKAGKLVQAANSTPWVASTLKAAKNHPIIARLIEGAGKNAVVGGATGAAHSEEGQEAGGAAGGAVGAVAGGLAGEALTPIAKAVAERMGLSTDARMAASQALRPSNRYQAFAQKFVAAAPYLDAENQKFPAQTLEDWTQNAEHARTSLYKNQIEPLIAQHASVPLSGIDIANQIRASITKEMVNEDPIEAQKIEEMANKFLPGSTFNLTMGDAEARLQYYNKKLAATGYWSLSPEEQAAKKATSGEVAGLWAATDAIRDEFYGKLQQLNPTADIAKLKADYGAVTEMTSQIRSRINVNNRQSPVSLKEMVGLMTGMSMHDVTGLLAATLPFVDREVNSAPNLLGRAVKSAATGGQPSTALKVANAATNVASRAGKATASAAGAAIGRRITFTASDGSVHSIPADQINQAVQIDPNLQVHP